MQARGRVTFVVVFGGLKCCDLLQVHFFGHVVGHDQAPVRCGSANMLVGWMDPNVHNFGTDVNFSLAAITFTLQGENGDVPLVISGNDERLPNINAGGHGTKGQCVLDNLVDFVVDHEMFVFSGRHGEIVVVVAVVTAAGDTGNPLIGGPVPRLLLQKRDVSQIFRRRSIGGRRFECGFADLVQLRPDLVHGPQIIFRKVVFENLGSGV
mmetsp:Transcript_29211/g.61058  ORF Transcript_29211/g.61058 Transcript_29211/m.61058 type:complete len:209 (-) Transcript_29211:76-702(-)